MSIYYSYYGSQQTQTSFSGYLIISNRAQECCALGLDMINIILKTRHSTLNSGWYYLTLGSMTHDTVTPFLGQPIILGKPLSHSQKSKWFYCNNSQTWSLIYKALKLRAGILQLNSYLTQYNQYAALIYLLMEKHKTQNSNVLFYDIARCLTVLRNYFSKDEMNEWKEENCAPN